ncbi:MAG: aspartate carbamoyltransferase [Thermaerobacter sp.]|nr:aspartate carbamoyltransferase [Thermaerobacter sp.]
MKWLPHTSLTRIADLDRQDIDRLIAVAGQMAGARAPAISPLAGRIVATLFYEVSTRTRLSFESAAIRLGAQVISVADAATSSVAKGETLADTVRIVAGYADAIVLRHPQEGAAHEAAVALRGRTPLINGGDGAGEHPTQALTDAYTLHQHFGRLDGLTVTFVGDLRYGRTVHSLAALFGSYALTAVQLVAPEGLDAPSDLTRSLGGAPVNRLPSLVEAAATTDVLYITRIQHERLPAGATLPDALQVDRAVLDALPASSVILHPLPRKNELPTVVDEDPRAIYFQQAANGVPMRMALLAHALG